MLVLDDVSIRRASAASARHGLAADLPQTLSPFTATYAVFILHCQVGQFLTGILAHFSTGARTSFRRKILARCDCR